MTRLVIVGGGRMGEALVAGLIDGGWSDASDLAVAEAVPARREFLAERFPGLKVTDRPVPADGAVLAVKPADVTAACEALRACGDGRTRQSDPVHVATQPQDARRPDGEPSARPLVGVARVLSIAAGVTLSTLEAALDPGTAVVRAMPNTPALVGAGAAAIAAGSATGPDDLAWAESILAAVGIVVQVPESALDAVTGLSGSGPAYLFLVAEAMVEAGVLNGLSRDVSVALTSQTLLGAGKLLAESGQSAAELRANVTSPGGTTAAGLRVLEQRAVRAAVLDAVSAATERSRELGR